MSGLVSDMLLLAKSDAQEGQIALSRVNLSDTVMGCLLPFEPVAFEQELELVSEIEPDLAVLGDEAKLGQLVAVLLDNACKYAGEKGKVTLSLFSFQDKVHLRVHNTGEPIPEEALPHIFERFYRVDSSRSRGSGGYGLGLAIARQIVGQHGGKLAVSSGERGTCFEASFPTAP